MKIPVQTAIRVHHFLFTSYRFLSRHVPFTVPLPPSRRAKPASYARRTFPAGAEGVTYRAMTMTERRSSTWFAATGRSGMNHRAWMRSQGFTSEVFDGRPVIGIATTWSELAPCNAHLHRVAESVKRGVWQAGGFPRSEEHTSNSSHPSISYAVFCL